MPATATKRRTFVLSQRERQIIVGIRTDAHDEHDGDLAVCDVVSREIQKILGWPMEFGECDHEPALYFHCWNILPDGSILDATSDQFGLGLDPLEVIRKGQPEFTMYRATRLARQRAR
jgi:hypothetical protein